MYDELINMANSFHKLAQSANYYASAIAPVFNKLFPGLELVEARGDGSNVSLTVRSTSPDVKSDSINVRQVASRARAYLSQTLGANNINVKVVIVP